MKRIPLDDFKPESYYDSAIMLDEGFLLLVPDTPVTQGLVDDLRTWGFKGVWTDGSLVGGSSPTAAAADTEGVAGAVLNNDAKEKEGRREARTFFEDLATFTRKVYETFNRDGHMDMSAITEKVKETIEMIKGHRAFILRMPDLEADGVDYLYTHSARTTILALTIGEAMKLPNFKLIELGIAGLLHEVGMLKIPKQMYDKATELTEKEKMLMTTHPTLGLRMLRDYSKENALPLPQDILMGVHQHHERANGTGYPQQLQGEAIHLFGRILGAACSYDAQISSRPHRGSIDGYSSLIRMLRDMQNLYDEKVIRALLNSLSIYPLGSYVRLGNSSIGVVVDTGADPRFPVVKLLLDEELHLFKEQPIIKTRDEEGYNVAGVLSAREIADLKAKELLPS